MNTYTRYAHEGILEYVERLTATVASDFATATMICTVSEAKDIALRPVFLSEGLPMLEPGWLNPTLGLVREAGGLFIAHEVQPRIGRNIDAF